MAALPIRSPSASPSTNTRPLPLTIRRDRLATAAAAAAAAGMLADSVHLGSLRGQGRGRTIAFGLVSFHNMACGDSDVVEDESPNEMLSSACARSPPLVGSDDLNIESVDSDRLKFEICNYSSFATNYLPHNIMIDAPKDQSSRWSSHNNNPPQYLTLKLKRPSLVRYIHFGKFEKSHVCNLKKFRVFGGLDQDHLVLLLEAGLKNDNVPEKFALRCQTKGGAALMPVMYIKIEPLLSWGPTFNYSIWYIELHGQDDPMYTSQCLQDYNKLREEELVRLCLKHFRQQGYHGAFKALQEQTQVELEHSLISDLHRSLVDGGNFKQTERFMMKCAENGLMDDYINRQDYKHIWRRQQAKTPVQPGYRGGHQLVVDSERRLIYLHGGWDGFQDLSDMWMYEMDTNTWSLLCKNAELYNGPTPRSCHKMVYDPVSENIFMLGRYLDNSIRTIEYIKSDFFLFNTRERVWLQICDDTSQVGGPHLIYDHQMCIDVEKRMIYVFGGKILTPRSITDSSTSEPEYSGLFSYHIATNTWRQLLVDCHHPAALLPDVCSIKSRITHCMVFHNKKRKLYIYGGQRGKLDMYDFLSFDVDTHIIEVLNKTDHNYNTSGTNGVSAHGNISFGSDETLVNAAATSSEPPPPSYTLRATIDCERNEIYVLSSFCKSKERSDVHQFDASNCFWMYSLDTHKWTRIFMFRYNSLEGGGGGHNTSNGNAHNNNGGASLEPCPRYAHQFVYDPLTKLHYLFGGNPGKLATPKLRLDDFWILELEKPKREEVLNHCRFLIRKLCYEEISRQDPLKALYYLRKNMADVIDHKNPDQVKVFHKLAALLFTNWDEQEEQEDGEKGEKDKDKEDENCNGGGMKKRPNYLLTPALGNDLEADENYFRSNDINAINSGKDHTQISGKESSSSLVSGDSDPSSEECLLPDQSCASSSTSQKEKRLTISDGSEESSTINNLWRNKRIFLFNQLVRLLPAKMAQPDYNLSDFVIL